MIHSLLALVWCVGCVFMGAQAPYMFWPAAFYAGREIAQAEYRYIQANGGHRADCPWWCGFIPSAWTLKSLLDCLLPFAVSLCCALAMLFL